MWLKMDLEDALAKRGQMVRRLASLLAAHPELEGRGRRPVDSARFGFTVDALLAALGRLEGPVSATDVARSVFGAGYGRGDVIRIGNALARLARSGQVVRHEGDSHRANRWEAAPGSDPTP